jgi:hypothetical protein
MPKNETGTDREISEAASEKKRRGRPRVIPEGWAKELARIHPEIKTERGHQNNDYAHTALRILSLLPQDKPLQGYEHLCWLADWERGRPLQDGRGQVGDPEELPIDA